MKAKKSVNTKGVRFEIGYALAIAGFIYTSYGAEMIVTSLNDGKHGTNSLHYAGRAADLRTRHLIPSQATLIFAALRNKLEPLGFDVIDERDKTGAPHFHIEYDPKPGENLIIRVE